MLRVIFALLKFCSATPDIIREVRRPHGPGGVLSYMGHIGMCRCEEYGFQAVNSSIGYINQSFCA